jgi:hypothetical protein
VIAALENKEEDKKEILFQDKNLFEDEKPKEQETVFSNLSGAIKDMQRRITILEERYKNLRSKTQITDQNMLESERNYNTQAKEISEDIMEIKHSINELNEKVSLFNAEFENVAKKNDLRVIEKYVELWDPTQFVRKKNKEKLKDNG